MKRIRASRAQSVSEYGICVAVIILAIIVMQVYVKRGLQGRYADVADFAVSKANTINQYEPYYTNIEEGSAAEGVTQSRKLATGFQGSGRLRTDVLTEKNEVPIRRSKEGLDSYVDP